MISERALWRIGLVLSLGSASRYSRDPEGGADVLDYVAEQVTCPLMLAGLLGMIAGLIFDQTTPIYVGIMVCVLAMAAFFVTLGVMLRAYLRSERAGSEAAE